MRFYDNQFRFGEVLVVRTVNNNLSYWVMFGGLLVDDMFVLDYYDLTLGERKKCILPESVYYEHLEGALDFDSSYSNSLGHTLFDLHSRYNSLCKEGLKELQRAKYNYNRVKKEYDCYRDDCKYLKAHELERASHKIDFVYNKYDILFEGLEDELTQLIPDLIECIKCKDFKFYSYKPTPFEDPTTPISETLTDFQTYNTFELLTILNILSAFETSH